MEAKPGSPASNKPFPLSWVNLSREMLLAYQSLGVVYGDLSTSPLYVYSCAFTNQLKNHKNEDAIFGAFSLIFWTITLIPLLKYVFIVLSADDNGEGGTFALYSLLCRHAKLSLLPNQQAVDQQLSAYDTGPSSSSKMKRFFEEHKSLQIALLLMVLLGACMLIGDGVFTPAILGSLVLPACVIVITLFALQHFGTHRVAIVFAPIIIIWLLSIFTLGLYNTIIWNPRIVLAFSPHYIIKFFKETGKDGWLSLEGILLCITGTEAMFADLGHFNCYSIRLAFSMVVYPCLVVQYMGQAAFLSRNSDSISIIFFDSIPEPLFWPMFIISTLAVIVASQAVITATFSIIKQCHALGCFPRVKVVHTSNHIYGRIYIPEINWILMFLTLAITVGFQNPEPIGNAFGLACISVMFITSFLMALVIIFVWRRSLVFALAFLLLFGMAEGLYLSSALTKVPKGGWVPIVLSIIFMAIMFVWNYGTCKKHEYDLNNKVPLKWILSLGPSLGIVRVPGIGLIYSELATGVPPIFSHFVTNLPAFHKVLVFVCIKSVQVPYVAPDERFLIGRVCPRPYRMYRCIVRYGYKDIRHDNGNFEDQLIQSIAEFIQTEEVQQFSSNQNSLNDKYMAVGSTRSDQSSLSLTITYDDENDSSSTNLSYRSDSMQSADSLYSEENPHLRKRHARYQLHQTPVMDPEVRDELLDLVEAKEAGVAYLMGHSHVRAMKPSHWLKRLAINVGYSFLRRISRGPSVALSVPHISMIEVGTIYYV